MEACVVEEWQHTCTSAKPATRLMCARWLHKELHMSWSRALDVERCVYAVTQDEATYGARMKHVMCALMQNPPLLSRDAATIARMSSRELMSSAVARVMDEERVRRDRFANMLRERYDSIAEETAHTDMQCKRCNSRKITFTQKQTRSADEATTVFVNCTQCNMRWRMN